MSVQDAPPQLNLAQRKALAARIAAAIALESTPLPAATAASKAIHSTLLEAIRGQADFLAANGSGRLDASLRQLAEFIDAQPIQGNDAAHDALRLRKTALARALRRQTCTRCERDIGKVCEGEDPASEDPIVFKGGYCIDEVKQLAELVGRWADELYSSAGAPPADHAFLLSTSGAHAAADQGLLKEFNISGWSEVREPHAGETVVGLVIKERALNWSGLAGLFYILIHETICHGLQSLDGGKRASAEEKCAWSEGWMDRLAFELTRTWLDTRPRKLPDWLRHNRVEADAIASQYHERRYAPSGTLLEADAERRRAARIAFLWLHDALGWAGPLETHPIVKFSVRLNAASLRPEQRERLTALLHGALETEGSRRFESAVGLCSTFADDGNVAALQQGLERLTPHLTRECGTCELWDLRFVVFRVK